MKHVTKRSKFYYFTFPCGLVARIRRFHRRGRGSIPRKGETTFFKEHNIGPFRRYLTMEIMIEQQ